MKATRKYWFELGCFPKAHLRSRETIAAVLTALGLQVTSVQAELVSQSNLTIDRLGSHDTESFYMTTIEGLVRACKYATLYCPSSNADCKSRYALALSAKMAGKTLSRIDYDFNSASGRCTLWLIEVK